MSNHVFSPNLEGQFMRVFVCWQLEILKNFIQNKPQFLAILIVFSEVLKCHKWLLSFQLRMTVLNFIPGQHWMWCIITTFLCWARLFIKPLFKLGGNMPAIKKDAVKCWRTYKRHVWYHIHSRSGLNFNPFECYCIYSASDWFITENGHLNIQLKQLFIKYKSIIAIFLGVQLCLQLAQLKNYWQVVFKESCIKIRQNGQQFLVILTT